VAAEGVRARSADLGLIDGPRTTPSKPRCQAGSCRGSSCAARSSAALLGGVARLLRVLPVAHRIETATDGWVVVASVELWDDHVVLHFAQEQRPAPGLTQRAYEWSISDDLETPYRSIGGGMAASRGGADDRERIRGRTDFAPAVPLGASELIITPPLLRLSEPVVVDLSS
jgi:hypothetical protein